MTPATSERDLMRQVLDLAAMFGWDAYHTALSKWSAKGFPDLTLVRPPRLVFVELKREKGKTTPEQNRWLGKLRGTAAEVYVWRPSDLERVAEVLR